MYFIERFKVLMQMVIW